MSRWPTTVLVASALVVLPSWARAEQPPAPPPESASAPQSPPAEPAPPAGSPEAPPSTPPASAPAQPAVPAVPAGPEAQVARAATSPTAEDEAILRALDFFLMIEVLRDFELFEDDPVPAAEPQP